MGILKDKRFWLGVVVGVVVVPMVLNRAPGVKSKLPGGG
jgi:hypothetical protein